MHVSVGEEHRAKCWLLISTDFPAVTGVTGVAAVYNLSVTGFVYLKLDGRVMAGASDCIMSLPVG